MIEDGRLALLKETLEGAISVFRSMVQEPMQEYIRNISTLTSGQEKIYVYISGLLTLSCSSRREFCPFIMELFEFDTCVDKYGIVQEGIVFKHDTNALEKKILKPYFGDLDIIGVLDYNINTNPVVIGICRVIKDALLKSDIMNAIHNYISCRNAIERLTPKPHTLAVRTTATLPPPGCRT
jgi:hypothetical protein